MKRKHRIANLIINAYKKRYKLAPQEIVVRDYTYPSPAPLERHLGYNRFLALNSRNMILLSLIFSATVVAIMAIYYYNTLVDTQQNMLASRGNVQALLQRRNDISQNLSKAVLDYSKHERGVFTSVVSLRSFMSKDQVEKDAYLQGLSDVLAQSKASVPFEGQALPDTTDKSLLSSLSKLMALAEQYPDLKLSSNFDKLMAALIEVEKDLATERIKLNDMTNAFTTSAAMFPCKIFAYIYGFTPLPPYFDATQEAKNFRLIEY